MDCKLLVHLLQGMPVGTQVSFRLVGQQPSGDGLASLAMSVRAKDKEGTHHYVEYMFSLLTLDSYRNAEAECLERLLKCARSINESVAKANRGH